MKRFKTIWHYGICFFDNEDDLYYFRNINVEYNTDIHYMGKISDMNYDMAKHICPIHEKCLDYYESAMTVLFKGQGKFSKGTEDPVLGLRSYMTKKEVEKNFEYILIWKLVKFE